MFYNSQGLKSSIQKVIDDERRLNIIEALKVEPSHETWHLKPLMLIIIQFVGFTGSIVWKVAYL